MVAPRSAALLGGQTRMSPKDSHVGRCRRGLPVPVIRAVGIRGNCARSRRSLRMAYQGFVILDADVTSGCGEAANAEALHDHSCGLAAKLSPSRTISLGVLTKRDCGSATPIFPMTGGRATRNRLVGTCHHLLTARPHSRGVAESSKIDVASSPAAFPRMTSLSHFGFTVNACIDFQLTCPQDRR